MTSAWICIFCLTLAWYTCPATGHLTCSAKQVENGTEAQITCFFGSQVSNDTHKAFIVSHNGHNISQESDIDVLACQFHDKTGELKCVVKKGYKYNYVITDQLILKIPNVTMAHSGIYTCQLIPLNKTIQPCSLSIEVQTTFEDTTSSVRLEEISRNVQTTFEDTTSSVRLEEISRNDTVTPKPEASDNPLFPAVIALSVALVFFCLSAIMYFTRSRWFKCVQNADPKEVAEIIISGGDPKETIPTISENPATCLSETGLANTFSDTTIIPESGCKSGAANEFAGKVETENHEVYKRETDSVESISLNSSFREFEEAHEPEQEAQPTDILLCNPERYPTIREKMKNDYKSYKNESYKSNNAAVGSDARQSLIDRPQPSSDSEGYDANSRQFMLQEIKTHPARKKRKRLGSQESRGKDGDKRKSCELDNGAMGDVSDS